MPSKRKRASTLTSQPIDNGDAPAQPSSRDASGEDTADVVQDNVLMSKKEHAVASSDPPAKRSRSSVKANQDSSASKSVNEDEADAEVDVDATMDGDGGENGEAGTMSMAAPPKAGMVEPVGYHTNAAPEGRPVRVYADGVFDLFHLGHMRQLQQAKTAFPDTYLIVGVTGDKETHRRKGLTVLSAKERAESVRHCKWVDEVVEDCPWIVTVDFLEKHQIDYVAHDDIPYGADEGDDIYKPVKEKGMFLVTQRTEGVSTTGIITKIVRDYEAYIARQLKRGTSRQELNISWIKKNELDIKRHVAELRDSIKTNWTTTGQELGKELRQFWQPSRQNSPARSLTETPRSRMSRLDLPGSAAREGGAGARNSDFAAGYAMGLIGGVRSWMQRTHRNLNDSVPQSPMSEEESPFAKSPTEPERGRTGISSSSKSVEDEVNAQVSEEMKTSK